MKTKPAEELDRLFEIFKKRIIDGTYRDRTIYSIAKELDIKYEMACRWNDKIDNVDVDDIPLIRRVPLRRKRTAAKTPIEQPKINIPKETNLKYKNDWQWVRVNIKEATKDKYDMLSMTARANLWELISQGIVDTDIENLGLRQEPIGPTTSGKRSSGVNIKLSPEALAKWQGLPIRCNKNVYVRKILEQMLK